MLDLSNLPRLPWDSFGPQLDEAVTALSNKLDREWPSHRSTHDGTGVVLRTLLVTSANTFRSIRLLCAEYPKDSAPALEHSLSVPPLARVILEALASTVFLFEDLSARTDWYFRSGWREVREEHQRIKDKHGADPTWAEWIAKHEEFVEITRSQWRITPAEAADLSLIKRWPIPDRMAKDKNTSPARVEFLQYLMDWFYRHLSQEAHLSWPGLARRTGALLERERGDEWRLKLEKYRSDVVGNSVVLLLAQASELESELRYGYGQKLRYVWGILGPYLLPARELYEMRYANTL